MRLLVIWSLLLASLARADADIIDTYRQGQAHWPEAVIDEGVEALPLGAQPRDPVYPSENPVSEARQVLGKHLFFERRLSASEQIACATCHDPDLGWADGRRLAIGHNRAKGEMNSPSILNTGHLEHIFWDGRARTLEEQALASWVNPIEMAGDRQAASARLQAIPGYPPMFESAFGTPEVTPDRVTAAIANFVRSMTLPDTRFDRFMRGSADALSDQEIRGLHLFRTKARCMNCHNGPMFSDNQFHHLGTSFHFVGNFEGRYRQTQQKEHVGAFRTPPLRGVGATAPYMHNGFAADLDMLLALYNMGWWQNAPPGDKRDDVPLAQLSPLIKPLHLEPDELADLKAFLQSLTGDMRYQIMPEELPDPG